MPAFNAVGSVGSAIRSLQGQSLADLEIVLVDDGSTDGTAMAMAGHASGDRRIRLAKLAENRGVAAAMNHGVALARGEFVARMDADDISHPERLERQVAHLEANPDVSVCATGIRVVGGGEGYAKFEIWINALQSHEAMARERFIETPVINPSAMIRRSAWDAMGGVRDLPWAEDYDLWLRLFAGGFRFAKLPEILLDWRDSPGRLTRRDSRYSHQAFLMAKAHHLARVPGLLERGVRVCGAGPIGKRVARLLQARAVRVAAFYEVNPRRIGQTIAGAPVLDQRGLPPAGAEVLIGAIGRAGARPLMRQLAAEGGYVEGDDFWLLA